MSTSKNTNQDEEDEKLIEEIRNKIKNNSDNKSNESNNSNRLPRSIDWRNPDEVKDYLDNLYVEYSFQCLSEKLPDGCHRLANFLENIRSKYHEATDLYKKTCDEMKYGRSCFVYSKNKSLGRGCTRDLLEACKYNFISCDYNIVDGCLNAGLCLLNGVGGLPTNVPESVKYFEKACDQNQPISCLRLFKLYIEGKNGVQKDSNKAFEYTKKACEANDMLGCLNASIMLRKGDGIPKDEKLSEFYRNRANEIKNDNESSRQHSNVTFGEQHK